MKKLIFTIIKYFNKTYSWLKCKDKFSMQRSAKIIILLMIVSIMSSYFHNQTVLDIAISCLMFVIIAMLFLFVFDTPVKIIKKITKNTCDTPRGLFKQMSHISYFYGLIFFSFEIFVIAEMILFCIFNKYTLTCMLPIWYSIMFIYTFFYFSYHIYSVDKKKEIDIVKQRIQLYTAIGTTLSFLMMLFGENYQFKVFVVGIVLEYTWLQYIISKELNDHGYDS